MPLQLTTPLNAGDMSASVYDHIKIIRQVHDARRQLIMVDLEYGTISGGDWVQGTVIPGDSASYPSSIIIDGSAYTTLVTTHASNDGELTYDAAKRGLYEFLQTNYPNLAGTII